MSDFVNHAICEHCDGPINDLGLGRSWQHTGSGSYLCPAPATNVLAHLDTPVSLFASPADCVSADDAAEAATDAFDRGWREGRAALYRDLRAALTATLDGISYE